MAEIPVTKKAGRPWWVWALLALIVGVVIYVVVGAMDEGDDAPAGVPASVGAAADGDGS